VLLAQAFSDAGVQDPVDQKLRIAAAMTDLEIEFEDASNPPKLSSLPPGQAKLVVDQVLVNLA
jgi:hypothetical protein